ncbi:hypothetical protein SAMN05444064_1232 [Pseudomonas syringae]|nr:hypothetical protein SAMN05444514_12482 [Pseudomonas syringae]SFM61148.1 hypothetical protein SAMN05444064_1232 [Pseudomonas syringae]
MALVFVTRLGHVNHLIRLFKIFASGFHRHAFTHCGGPQHLLIF